MFSLVLFVAFLAFLAFLYVHIVAPVLWSRELSRLRFLLEQRMSSCSHRRRNFLLLANPSSGGNRAMDVVINVVTPLLEQCGNSVRVVGTEMGLVNILPEHFEGIDVVVVFGGDGTFNRFINLPFVDLSRLRVALVPCGSSNGFSRSFSKDLYGALENVFFGAAKPIDLLEVSFKDAQGKQQSVLEAQVVALGIIAEHDLLQEDTLRPYMGPLLRGVIAPFVVMLRANHYKYQIRFEIAEEIQRELEAQALATSTAHLSETYNANAVLLMGSAWGDSSGRAAPGARLDDGAWDVVLFVRDSALGLIRTFIAIHNHGKHVQRPRIQRFAWTACSISPQDPGPSLLTISGERFLSQGTISCTVLPKKLSMLSAHPLMQ